MKSAFRFGGCNGISGKLTCNCCCKLLDVVVSHGEYGFEMNGRADNGKEVPLISFSSKDGPEMRQSEINDCLDRFGSDRFSLKSTPLSLRTS